MVVVVLLMMVTVGLLLRLVVVVVVVVPAASLLVCSAGPQAVNTPWCTHKSRTEHPQVPTLSAPPSARMD